MIVPDVHRNGRRKTVVYLIALQQAK